jgi:aminoglycoside 3-N-acetyltransferase I
MTSARYTYRQLTGGDVALLKDLLRVFAEAFAEVDTYQRSVPSDEYLAVLEGHRRKGIATGMIGALSKIAAERQVYVIFVQADLGDSPAIALYESLGTKETAHHFDIEVRVGRRREAVGQKKAPLDRRG